MELACIRWFPAHVLYLTFFKNIVLLAGFSWACRSGARRPDPPAGHILWTPVLLVAAMAGALWSSTCAHHSRQHRRRRPARILPSSSFSARKRRDEDVSRFRDPDRGPGRSLFFALIALAFVGPPVRSWAVRSVRWRISGAELHHQRRGSIAGILAFRIVSWAEIPPPPWSRSWRSCSEPSS